MISEKAFSAIALSFPETEQAPHFEITSFRVNKKIFATLNMPQKRCTLKFNKEYQDIFVSIGKGKINAVPNAWGRLGWTTIDLHDIDQTILKDAMLIAWRCTAPKKYEKLYASWYIDEE